VSCDWEKKCFSNVGMRAQEESTPRMKGKNCYICCGVVWVIRLKDGVNDRWRAPLVPFVGMR